MSRPRIYTYALAGVYPHYVTKVEKKGRTQAELETVICWLTGYSGDELAAHLSAGTDLESFFLQAPALNPGRLMVTGLICGIRVEAIEDTMTREIRIMDKLVDELAKGRPLEKIFRGHVPPTGR